MDTKIKLIALSVVVIVFLAIGLFAYVAFTPHDYTTTLTTAYNGGPQGVIVASPGPPAP